MLVSTLCISPISGIKPDKKFMAMFIYRSNSSSASVPPKLSPWYVTGFSDAESSFQIHISERSANKLGWRVKPRFDIYLDKRDLDLLYLIQSYFGGVGSIIIYKKINKASFNVNKLEDFVHHIIPHFEKFPLQSAKQIDYSLWKECILLMVEAKHLTQTGLEKILSAFFIYKKDKTAINRGLSKKLFINFPSVVPRPEINQSVVEPLNPQWISGFSDGDSSFHIINNMKTNNVQARFIISLNERELPLLLRIKEFFWNIGSLNSYVPGYSKEYAITKRSDLINRIIPHFKNFPLIGNKLFDFNIWSEIVTLMEGGAHLTPQGGSDEKIKNLNKVLNKRGLETEKNSYIHSSLIFLAMGPSFSLWSGIIYLLLLLLFFLLFTSFILQNKEDKIIGLMDGDWYFDIGEQKQYNKAKALVKSTIRIRLASNVNVRDLPLLEYFVQVLGVGKISTMSGEREQVRVIFSKKDLVTVILPLIKEYNLQFLTSQRVKQFALLNYILENFIIHWDNVNFKNPEFVPIPSHGLVNLDFFADWSVGFTMAEGSFGIKGKGSAFYQARRDKQKGIDNYPIIKAIGLLITGREVNETKPDSADCYQLTLSSKSDVQKVISFFSSPEIHSLYSYKLNQYTLWLTARFFIYKKDKNSSRYSKIIGGHDKNKCASPGSVSTLLVQALNFIKTMKNTSCLKCWIISFLIISFSVWLINCDQSSRVETFLLIMPSNSTSIKKIRGDKRIGPHSIGIISIIFGSLLGGGGVERKKDGTRITFFQEAMHVKYLLWLHDKLAISGYCNQTTPTIYKRLGKKGKVRKIIGFATWKYSSFDWIYEEWYIDGIKRVPSSIEEYLTPLGLAILIMDSGVKDHKGLCLKSLHSYVDCLLLVQVLHKNFGLKAIIQSTGVSSEYRVHILKESLDDLRNIVGPFIIPSMKYKPLPASSER